MKGNEDQDFAVLVTSQWSSVPALFMNLSPFHCWVFNLKIVGKAFTQVSVQNCNYSCGWDSVTVKTVEHPLGQGWSSSQSLNEPQTIWGGSRGSTGALCQAAGTGVSVLIWLRCSHPAHPRKQNKKWVYHPPASFMEEEEAHGLGFVRHEATSLFCLCARKLQLTHCWSFPWEGPVPTKLTDTWVSSLNKVV